MEPLQREDPVAAVLVGAIRSGDLPALRQLLSDHPGLAGARLVGHDGCSRTPLHVATDWPGYFPDGPEVVRLLLAAGAASALGRRHDLPGACPGEAEEDRGRLSALLGADFAARWAEGEQLDAGAAVAYARRARGQRRRPASGWEALTPTEIEVARLAAAGLSNPAIGQRLFVSRATVKTHLEHADAKLGLHSRAELAALAARRSGNGIAESATDPLFVRPP